MLATLIRTGHALGLRREHAARFPIRNVLRALGRRGCVPQSAIGGIPVCETSAIEISPGHHFLYNFDHLNDPIGEFLYWQGFSRYEPQVLRCFLELAAGARCFLDIGANTGVFTLAACAANPSVRAIAWEPVPSIFALLTANLSVNGFADRVECRQTALADRAGVAELRLPNHCSTSASLVETNFSQDVASEFLEVPVETGDSVVAGRKVDLIKIDVETAEVIVLRGLPRVLAESRPAIIAECLPSAREATRTFLASHGYAGTAIDETNYLFLPS